METKLYVSNLSPLTSAEDLRILFSRTGGVISVDLIKDKRTGKPKGFAFVEMMSQGDAGKAVSEFNGYQLDQRRIKVAVAKSDNNKKARRGKAGFNEYKSYNDIRPDNFNHRRY